jgi:8-oxo-dGTP pyrophosphatase MutT (NUDIX family)
MRQRLLQLIDDYALRYPEEAAMTGWFRAFVAGEPRCYERNCWRGHVTGSAWLVDESGGRVLLTHHRKLDRWLQLGGHSDGDPDTLSVAVREAAEESGLPVRVLDERIFDLDVHEIPARKRDPSHWHFDVRFALVAGEKQFTVSAESHSLAWVSLDELAAYTAEASMLRMAGKWRARSSD